MSGVIIVILFSLLPDNPYLRGVEPAAWRFDPPNGTTGLTYDANGNLLRVTDARSNATAESWISISTPRARATLLRVGNDTRS